MLVRNRIYFRVFDREWVVNHMPDAELRRQQRAFRHGVVRTSLVSGVVLGMMVFLALYADHKAREANSEAERSRRSSAEAFLAQARAARGSGHAGQRFESLKAIVQASAVHQPLKLRNEAIACLAQPDIQRGETWADLYPAGSTTLAFSADFERFACGSGAGVIHVESLRDPAAGFDLGGTGMPVAHVQFSPHNRWLASVSSDGAKGQLDVWDLAGRRTIWRWQGPVAAQAVDFSPDGDRLVFGAGNRELITVDIATHLDRTLTSLEYPASCVRFAPLGKRLAVTMRGERQVLILDAYSGDKLHPPLFHRQEVTTVAWHPAGSWLAAGCDDRQIYIWDAEKGEEAFYLKGSDEPPTQLAYSHAGDLLASCGDDDVIRLWHPVLEHQVVNAPAHKGRQQLAFSPDDARLGFFRDGSTVGVWDVATGRECRLFYGHRSVVQGPQQVTISPHGRIMASVARDGIQLWDLNLGQKLDFLAVRTSMAWFHPVTSALFASDVHGVHRWPISWKEQAENGPGHLGPANLLPFPNNLGPSSMSANGEALAVIKDDQVYVWNSRPQEVEVFPAKATLNSVAISPDGTMVAAGSQQAGKILVWDVSRKALLRQWNESGGAQVLFSPDSHWLVTGSRREYVFHRLSGPEKPGLRIPREDSFDELGVMAFSPDGSLFAAGVSRTVVRLVDPTSGQVRAELTPMYPWRLSWLAFGPQGGRLAAATDNHLIQVWDLARIRQELARLRLDWESPPVQARANLNQPIDLEVELGQLDSPTQQLRLELEKKTHQVETMPDLASSWSDRGRVLEQLGRFNEALADYDHALSLEEDPYYWESRSRVLEKLNRLDESYAAYGMRELLRADTVRAIENFRRSLALRPDQPKICHQLAWLYLNGPLQCRDPAAAEQLLPQAAGVALSAKNKAWMHLEGLHRFRQGDFLSAETFFLGVAEKDRTPFDWLCLAMCCERRNQHEEARKAREAANDAWTPAWQENALARAAWKRFCSEADGIFDSKEAVREAGFGGEVKESKN